MEISIRCYLDYGACLVLCSSKEGGRKNKLRVQRCKNGEDVGGCMLRLGAPRKRQMSGDTQDVQSMDV